MPPNTTARPTTNPIATRTSGGTRLCSKEYFTKNATPRNSASPPIHAKSFAPMNCSQLIAGRGGFGGGTGGGGDVDLAAAVTSLGNGGGTAAGRVSGGCTTRGETGAGATGSGFAATGRPTGAPGSPRIVRNWPSKSASRSFSSSKVSFATLAFLIA